MSSLKEKFDNFLYNPKTLVFVNTLGVGLLGYYLYQSQKQYIIIDDMHKQQQLQNQQFEQNNDAVSVKVAKRRQNAKRMSALIKQDSMMFAHSLKIPATLKTKSTLIGELRYMDSSAYDIQRIPHLAIDCGITTYTPIKNPLVRSEKHKFIDREQFVVATSEFTTAADLLKVKKFARAGPRQEIYFQPKEVKALIVTCGGLCPGLNSVIREIVMSLHYNYDVQNIYGSSYGYQGIYNPSTWVKLEPLIVKNIHKNGGTFLGTSRGGFDLEKILNAIVKHGVNQLYIIGGDGTHAGIYEIYREVSKRNLKIAVSGIPKTIDNDIPIIDCSFGYQTSLEEAQRAIQAAWVEAHSHEYGVGLVKLMGRQAGWIAMGASYAARNVNVCLIPEEQFDFYGEKGLLEHIYQRLTKKSSCVIVVAEGAIEGCRDLKMEFKGTDKSGNPVLPDIANQVRKEIITYMDSKGISVTLKYIDPSYMIRSVPPNAQDQKICSYVAQNAVHGCMAGFTGFSNGLVNGKNVMISLKDLLSKNEVKNIPKDFRQWRRFLISSGQPSFLNKLPDDGASQASITDITSEDELQSEDF